MARNQGERLAKLESEVAQLRKELELLWARRKGDEALSQDVERLNAWRSRVHERTRYGVRMALWLAAAIGLQYASGAWARVLGDLARQLARGLV